MQALALAAVAGLVLVPPAMAKTTKINFGYLVADQIHEPAPLIMKEKKLLEKRGLEVKWGEYLAGSYLCQFMASGEVDFGTGGAVPVIITRGQGVDLQILAGSNTEGSSIVVGPQIKTIADLNGKSLGTPGIGSIQDAMVDMVAKKNNIRILHKNMKVSDMPVFLQKGEIDGFIAWEPHPSRAIDLGYGRAIASSKDILPNHQCCVLIGRGDLIAKEPELVATVLDAYIEALDWFQANRAEATEMIAKATGMKPEVVTMALATVSHPNPPVVDVASIKLMTEGLLTSGKLSKQSNPDMDKFIAEMNNTRFLDEYLKHK
jgi:NitT/TauT family transport system substrate-binding protein